MFICSVKIRGSLSSKALTAVTTVYLAQFSEPVYYFSTPLTAAITELFCFVSFSGILIPQAYCVFVFPIVYLCYVWPFPPFHPLWRTSLCHTCGIRFVLFCSLDTQLLDYKVTKLCKCSTRWGQQCGLSEGKAHLSAPKAARKVPKTGYWQGFLSIFHE